MSEYTVFLLYDYQDLQVLLKSKKRICKIIPLNAKVYTETKDHFSDKVVEIYNIKDEFKKKIIEEAFDLENFLLKEINQIKDINDSTRFNLISHFTILNKIILGYWYAIPDKRTLGIIYKNKILISSNKKKAIYYLMISLFDKSQSIFDLNIYKSTPSFLFRFINYITLLFFNNRNVIWTSSPSKRMLSLIAEARLFNNKIISMSFFSLNKNFIYKLIFSIYQIKEILFNNHLLNVKIFPITNSISYSKNKLNFINDLKNPKFKYLKEFIINYLETILIQSEALSNYSSNIVINLNSKIFLGDHMRGMDGAIMSNIYKQNNLKSILISHGSHTVQNDFYGNYASNYMFIGLLYSPFATCIVCQSPSAYEAIKEKNIESKIVKTVPIMWSSKKILKKNKYLDKFTILHASTCKLMHTRPWAYEDTFEFILNLNKIISVINKIPNTLLLIRIRPHYELSKKTLIKNLIISDNYIIKTSGNFEDDILNSDFMISYSSTTIEESLHYGRPVGLLGVSSRYRHFPESISTNKIRKAIYHLNHKDLHDDLLKIKSKHINNPLNEEEIKNYVWGDNVYSKKDFVFNQLLK